METETLKPIDKVSLREATSHQAVAKVNALRPESEYAREPSLHPKGEGNMNTDYFAVGHSNECLHERDLSVAA